MKILKSLFVLLLLINSFSLAQENNKEKIPAIVSLDWLKTNFDDKDIVIVDLRTKEEYDKGHIKKAVNIPGLKSLFDDKFFMPKLDYLKDLFSDAGIDRKSKVVAYDNGDFIWAARFYWILETLGHDEVALLKVGYSPWLKTQIETSILPYKTKRKEFIPRIDNEKVETKIKHFIVNR